MRTFLLCFLGLSFFTACEDPDDDSGVDADPRCIEFCEKTSSCPGATSDRAGCPGGCQTIAQLNDASGCEDEYASRLSCAEGLADVCDEAQAGQCDDLASQWLDCVYQYCQAHPEDENCQ